MIENYLELIYDKYLIEKQAKLIKTISDILPMCAYCWKIRDGEGEEWMEIEKYVEIHYNQTTSHGICQDCLADEIKKIESHK